MPPFLLAELRDSVQLFIRRFGLLEQTVTPCGYALSLSQVFALQELETARALSVTELADRLKLERSSVSRLADGLVKAGFVDRQVNETNRREVRLTLTDKGVRTIGNVRRQSIGYYESVIGHLTDDDKRRIADGFRLFAEALERRDAGKDVHP
ncbi:MarR family winged helix-turn-helix transcriptional regulator [Paenibacillus flagellatus]|uniref:MarR family transcriptional regulator n=1 Tax=Paenibacillus flagellatus TaxID=2211139 RepID=A0A2V5K2L1_9BACL|nr:MarR family transcriptional regulator [Paenibacillus flagellatus]PYI52852.1 MarR family transcriptional regulator [Paenibacillus flagellatus]